MNTPAQSLALVTGGSGYFGEVLAQRLLDRGARVRVLDLNESDFRHPRLEYLRGDIRDPTAVENALRGVSQVYHNVAQVPLAKDRKLFWSVNYEGTRLLLDTARKAGVNKFVYTSSSAVFGVPAHNPVTEETQPSPAEEYGRAKLAGEHACAEAQQPGMDIIIIRPRTILGHGRLGIFQILFEWIYQGFNIPLMGSGENIYQFIHAADLADASILAAEKGGSNTFNIGAAKFGSMQETLQALIRHAGSRSRLRCLPARPMELCMNVTSTLGLTPLGPYHALMYGRSMYFDTAKARDVLGWQPKYSNIEMICESYDWYKAHREKILAANHGSPHSSRVKERLLGLVKYVL